MKVIANFAMTFDGKVTTRTGAPTTFTSPLDKQRLRQIRALGDALLAGASTVKADSMTMGLNCVELQRQRLEQGRAAEPLRAIVSNSGKVSTTWKVFKNPRTPLLLFGSEHAEFTHPLPDFCQVIRLNGPRVELGQVLKILNEKFGCQVVVCEGGPRLFASLVSSNLVDELYLTIVPAVFGGQKAATITGLPGGEPSWGTRFEITSIEQVGQEVFLKLAKVAARKKNL